MPATDPVKIAAKNARRNERRKQQRALVRAIAPKNHHNDEIRWIDPDEIQVNLNNPIARGGSDAVARVLRTWTRFFDYPYFLEQGRVPRMPDSDLATHDVWNTPFTYRLNGDRDLYIPTEDDFAVWRDGRESPEAGNQCCRIITFRNNATATFTTKLTMVSPGAWSMTRNQWDIWNQVMLPVCVEKYRQTLNRHDEDYEITWTPDHWSPWWIASRNPRFDRPIKTVRDLVVPHPMSRRYITENQRANDAWILLWNLAAGCVSPSRHQLVNKAIDAWVSSASTPKPDPMVHRNCSPSGPTWDAVISTICEWTGAMPRRRL